MRFLIKFLIVCNLFLFGFWLPVNGQSESDTDESRVIDSLLLVVKKSNQDTIMVKIYMEIGSRYFYYLPDSAILYYQKALGLSQKLNAKKFAAKCFNNIGNANSQQGNYDEALECYLKAVIIYEEIGDKKRVAMCYNNIGLVQSGQSAFDKALKYYFKSLGIFTEIGDKKGMSLVYNNIGIVYWDRKIYETALEYYHKSLKIDEELGNVKGMADSYNNIGLIFSEQFKFNKALEYYFKSLKIAEDIGDKNGISGVYENLGVLYIQLNQYEKAIAYSNKGLKIAEEIGSLPLQKLAYENLSKANDSIGNYRKAYEYIKESHKYKDSIFNLESSQQIKIIDARYQNEKKEKEIALLNKDKELQKIEVKRQKMQKYALFLGFALMLALAFVSFRSYRNKKKANIALAEQKHQIEEKNFELNQQNEEISAQRDEIEAQRDIVTMQKNSIEEIHEKLTSSIRYAERIQHAVLPSEEMFKMFLANYFILFKPRDVVSGDFYWSIIKKNKLLIAVADCTGHGVPGAFMSMLGISFLNEIIAQTEFTTTSFVLNKLREYIIKSLQQQGVSGEQKDGMDISLVAIDLETYKMQFSGANNSIYIIKRFENLKMSQFENEEIQSNFQIDKLSNQLIELKGDKMPVAIHVTMNDFADQEMQLTHGNTLYLFSDGYADQFGGYKGRKFMYSKLKELFLSISDKPMNEQGLILDRTILSWMNDHETKYEQTDDITVLGVRI